jgi:hypothetical protein
MMVSTAAPSAQVPKLGPSAQRTLRSVLPFSASGCPGGAKYLRRQPGQGFGGSQARI